MGVKTYPIMLDIRGRRAVVVGAGSVGLRKVRSLAEAGAEVRLITGTDAPEGSGKEGGGQTGDGELAGAEIVHQEYRPELLEGAFVVFACTGEAELNRRIAADARKAGALVNVANRPEDCDFFLPAIFRDGDVVVAVGTGATAPALAGQLRDRLAAATPERIGEFAALLGRVRDKLKQDLEHIEHRTRIMKRLSEQAALELFLAGGEKAILDLVDELTEAI